MECDFMQLAGKVGHFTSGKNCPLVILSSVHGIEGDKAMSPSFEAENKVIDASSASLEARIGARYMQRGSDVSSLPMANKTPVCQS